MAEIRDPAMISLVQQVEAKLAADLAAQSARFAAYEPRRPADEPHEPGCQIVRYNDPRMCCTCESNRTRRRQQVVNAALAKDYAFRETLGGMESHAFDLAARERRLKENL